MALNVKFEEVEIPAESESYQIESALLKVTEEMNHTPLVVNEETWAKAQKFCSDLSEKLVEECVLMTGNEEFRPNSSVDCAKEFQARGREVRKTATGRVSVDKDVLKSYARAGDELAVRVIHAREAMTKLSQLNAWKPYALAGSVQCVWDQFGTPMARYTSDNPNLQNRIVEIRETVEPPTGYSFLSLDLKQAEYRVWASLAKDPVLRAAFEGGREFHIEMAKEIMAEVPNLNTWGDDLKKFGKTTNFAILYGMQTGVLASQLGCPGETAARIVKAYEKRASAAVEYKAKVLEQAKLNGYVETKFGRRRLCPGFSQAVWPQSHEISKTVWHHHNAGTAAELVKKKTVRMMEAVREKFSMDEVRIGLQMHDEVILVVKDSVMSQARPVIEATFCQQEEGFIELGYEIKVGKNWLEVSK